MINVKLYNKELFTKHNLFIEVCIPNDKYNSISYLFDVIINKLIEYKNRDVYFASIRSLIGIMLVEMKHVDELELEDFFRIFQYRFDVLDNKIDVFNGWYHFINQDIEDIKGITLHQFNMMINDDKYIKKYFRMIKLQKLSKL